MAGGVIGVLTWKGLSAVWEAAALAKVEGEGVSSLSAPQMGDVCLSNQLELSGSQTWRLGERYPGFDLGPVLKPPAWCSPPPGEGLWDSQLLVLIAMGGEARLSCEERESS